MTAGTDSSRFGWVDEVLGFWFDTLGPASWFKKSDDVDAEITRRFRGLHEHLAAGGAEATDNYDLSVEGASREFLARIIVLDQFPRNMFRGSPRAFASDGQALALAQAAVGRGLDTSLPVAQRLFVYLPYEHSEDATDQATSVRLISALGDAELTRFAVRHQEIIARFGRFPHRNAILGRISTPEEQAFLNEPDSAF